jgi:hypothetical protein
MMAHRWHDWYWGIGCALAGFCVAYASSYLIRPAYRAETTIVEAPESGGESSLSGVTGQLGGLGILAAGLGGLNDPQRVAFVETLRSPGLARKFLRERGLVAVLCGTRSITCGHGAESDENRALRTFRRNILDVAEDKRTGVIRVAITWFDRREAAEWANQYVVLANRELQTRAITGAHQRVAFLEKAAAETDIPEVRSAIFALLESQIKTEMFATTRPEFAFRVIDSAVAPDASARARPLRSLMGLVGATIAVALLYASMKLRRSVPGRATDTDTHVHSGRAQL